MLPIPKSIFDLALRLGPVEISPHVVFEMMAYAAGFALYRRDRRKLGDPVRDPDRNSLIVAAILGAALGSKLLVWLEDPATLIRHADWLSLFGGKTIVGGLMGGTLAVEWVKIRLKITTRTGDLFAIPLALGIAIGRIGCFLAGIKDHTYGVATALPWGVDFGDGITRHPVQLYEVAFLLGLAALLVRLRSLPHREGDLYRVFLVAYLAWRLAIDFWKPELSLAGLSAIQWVCMGALLWYARDMTEWISRKKAAVAHG
jgi:phosphatidylglycerol:prolipoprotein diacylglycerol transferase